MEIPKEVQDKLKCNACDALLSCGPVYLLHESGETICGRCSQHSEDRNSGWTRNKQYEAIASLLVFPCVFAAHGCPEKLTFTLGQPPHESTCQFRPFTCLVAPHRMCEWIGSWPTLKEHCSEKHASNILENPGNIPRPHLIASNLQTYIISAFRFLFLLHVKVCVTSGNLYHSLRMFGDSKFLDNFSYSLQIEGNNIKLTEYGSVLPAGLMTLQELTSNSISINNLLEILGDGFDKSKFTITIETLIRKCFICLKNYNCVSDSKFCAKCKEKLVKCKFNNKNCSFVDVHRDKCEKHERYFCEYQTECFNSTCFANIVRGSMTQHLVSSKSCQKTVESSIDSVVRLTNIYNNMDYVYILFTTNNIGTVICQYAVTLLSLKLYLYTSLPTYELKNFKCSIELTDPQTKHTQIFTPQIQFYNWPDWLVDEQVNNFPSWKNVGIDIKINIDKNVP